MHTNRHVQYWVIPPEANAEFAAHMEDILDVYTRPYEPNIPVLCMDEQPVQLVEEVKVPIAATRNHPKRVDYEYKRAGVAATSHIVDRHTRMQAAIRHAT